MFPFEIPKKAIKQIRQRRREHVKIEVQNGMVSKMPFIGTQQKSGNECEGECESIIGYTDITINMAPKGKSGSGYILISIFS